MDGIILLTVFFCSIILNIVNVYKIIILRYEKKYIPYLAMPSLIYSFTIIMLAIISIYFKSIQDCMDFMMFVGIIVQSIFSIIVATIVAIKCLFSKDSTYLPIVLIYGVATIWAPVANCICSIITYVAYIILKITYKKKKLSYSYLRNNECYY